MRSIYLHSPRFNDFDFGPSHPFKSYRARLVYEMCHRYGLLAHPWISVVEPEPAHDETALTFHTADYMDSLKAANSGYPDFMMAGYGLGSGDNPVFKGVYDLAMLMLGATMRGAELISRDQADIALNINGGLHHAKPAYAEGFCYVNDIAVAIKFLLAKGYERILYVDIDAHHGNGVQDAFYASNKVLFLSLHQSGDTIYPGTGFEQEMGTGDGYGYTVNLPLPQYTDDEAYVLAFKAVYPPLVEAFRPQIVVAQIGLDTLKRDPLTNLRCTNNGYREVISVIKDSCPKILALGGGGYSIPDVVRGWTIAWAVLNGLDPQDSYEGLLSGDFGHNGMGEKLFDEPYRISPGLKDAVNRFIDGKIAFIHSTVFPLLGAHP